MTKNGIYPKHGKSPFPVPPKRRRSRLTITHSSHSFAFATLVLMAIVRLRFLSILKRTGPSRANFRSVGCL